MKHRAEPRALKQGRERLMGAVRCARRGMARALDRHGYYMAVGVCAAMVFAGALVGTSGRAPATQGELSAGQQVSDISPLQPSAGDGLLVGEADARAALADGEAAARLERWPTSGREVLTAHALVALIYQPTLGAYATHAGIDIACSEGQEVVACADGQVIGLWREALLGNVVEVRTEAGAVLRYGNLAALDRVSAGMEVSAGDVLGQVGSSAMGESLLAPHLHFEVLVDGQSVPPLDWLPK